MLQQHFRNLEALALDLMEPEQAVDLTCKEAGVWGEVLFFLLLFETGTCCVGQAGFELSM